MKRYWHNPSVGMFWVTVEVGMFSPWVEVTENEYNKMTSPKKRKKR